MAVATWSTANFPTDLAEKSFSGMITRLMPNGQAPLFGISSMLGEETAYQIEHGYYSKTMIFPSVVVGGGGQLIGDTTFTVVSTVDILPGMMLQVDTTRENILVLTVTNATTVTVQRAVGTVAAVAIAASVRLYMVGNAYEEASVRPQSLVIIPVRQTNFTQIFRNTWLMSGTAIATSVIAGGSPDAESKQDCSMFHAVDIEKAILFGQLFTGTRNGFPFRTMNGVINYINQQAAGNITTLGATTTYTQFETSADPVFQQVTDPKNPNERLFFAGGFARRVLHAICRLNSTYMINDQVTEWGLQFDTVKIPRGRFNIVEHPLFNAFGSPASWSKMAVILDLTSFNLAYMRGRKTQARDFNMAGTPVDNGIDAVGGTLTTELTCLVKNPPANGQLLNFTAGAVG
jgi:hypothetical protein